MPKPSRALFVAAYLVSPNQTEAAIAAGYSEKTAKQQGCRLMKDPWVAAEIAKGQAKLAKKYEITAERVLQELALLAFAPLGDKHVSTSDKRAALVDLAKHLNLFKPALPDPFTDQPDDDSPDVPIRDSARALLFALATAMKAKAGKAAPAATPTKH